MHTCEHCGQQVPDNARYCTRCGAPQPYDKASVPPPTWQDKQAPPPAPIQPPPQGGYAPPPSYQQPPPYYQQPPYQQPGPPPVYPPPQGGPREPITSRWAWGMAFAPVLVGLLVSLLGLSAWIVIAYVYFTLVTLLMLDISAMMRAGLKAESWMWLGIIMPPIYLHMRAQKLDRQFGYFYLQLAILLAGLLILIFV